MSQFLKIVSINFDEKHSIVLLSPLTYNADRHADALILQSEMIYNYFALDLSDQIEKDALQEILRHFLLGLIGVTLLKIPQFSKYGCSEATPINPIGSSTASFTKPSALVA